MSKPQCAAGMAAARNQDHIAIRHRHGLVDASVIGVDTQDAEPRSRVQAVSPNCRSYRQRRTWAGEGSGGRPGVVGMAGRIGWLGESLKMAAYLPFTPPTLQGEHKSSPEGVMEHSVVFFD